MTQITGKIKMLKQIEVVSDKFKKREIVVTTDETYPQHISMQFTQDRCNLLDGYNVGDEVKISINIRGREWTNPKDNSIKYFNTLEGWRIEGEKSNVQTTQQPAEEIQQPETFTATPTVEDDLPF